MRQTKKAAPLGDKKQPFNQTKRRALPSMSLLRTKNWWRDLVQWIWMRYDPSVSAHGNLWEEAESVLGCEMRTLFSDPAAYTLSAFTLSETRCQVRVAAVAHWPCLEHCECIPSKQWASSIRSMSFHCFACGSLPDAGPCPQNTAMPPFWPFCTLGMGTGLDFVPAQGIPLC